MTKPFPEPILKFPLADIPLEGVTAYLSQAADHQILFMHFSQDVDLEEHSHEAQWGIVLEGNIRMKINGESKTYSKGDSYFIPAGVKHSALIQAGYKDMTFFDEPKRYTIKETGEG